MEKDLFGNVVKKKRSRIEILLSKHDRDTLPQRINRIKYLKKVIPKGSSFLYSIELHYLLSEAQATFINGQFVSTLILAQSFIEQWLHNFLTGKGFESEAKRGFKEILKVVKRNKYLPEYVIGQLEEIRRIRNPFTHLKPNDYDFLLPKLTFIKRLEPDKYLEKKAQEAIELIFSIPFILKLET